MFPYINGRHFICFSKWTSFIMFPTERKKRNLQTPKTLSETPFSNCYFSVFIGIYWPVWLSGWVLVYELSGCGFESSYSHLNFRFRACIEQGVPWHSGAHRVWIHSETPTWHDKNIQSKNTKVDVHLKVRFFCIYYPIGTCS